MSAVEEKQQTPADGGLMAAFDPGCVKTRLGEGRAELFSQLPSSERVTSTIDSYIDEIEMEVLHASWASEFSHSLDPTRTLRKVQFDIHYC